MNMYCFVYADAFCVPGAENPEFEALLKFWGPVDSRLQILARPLFHGRGGS